jgi:septal ring factor EnvC (AmiA/AmiB activator)
MLLWFLLFAVCLGGWAGSAHLSSAQEQDQLHQKRQELRQIQRQLSQYQQQLHDNSQQEVSLLATLDAIALHQEELARRLRHAEQDLRATQQHVQDLQQVYNQRYEQMQDQRQVLMQRLRRLYKLGRQQDAAAFFAAKDVTEFTYKVQYMRRMAVYDRQQIERYHDTLQQLMSARASLIAAQQHLIGDQETIQQHQAALTQERQHQAALLRRIRQEKHLAEEAVTELAQASEKLTHFIAQLREARKLKIRSTVVKGHIDWPVDGPILSPYGRIRHRQLDVDTIQNGISIGAPLGSDVRAVEAGKVVYADWFKGFGRLLIIDHGDQVISLYGHTSEILVGVDDTVQAHQIVAHVGNSSAGGDPALYFEIRHRTVPQDPLLWLRQRAARLAE